MNLLEPRVKAGVLLAAPGGGDALSEFAAEHYSFFSTTDFAEMTTPAPRGRRRQRPLPAPDRARPRVARRPLLPRTQLGLDDAAWQTAQSMLTTTPNPLGRIESK